jgi:hypothetical protein
MTAHETAETTLLSKILFTPFSSTNKNDRHDITEIWLKVALKHQQANTTSEEWVWPIKLLFIEVPVPSGEQSCISVLEVYVSW